MNERKIGRFLRVACLMFSSSAFAGGVRAQADVSTGAADSPNERVVPPAYPPCLVEPDDAATEAAKGAFQAGNAAFQEADYDRAILYWEDSYRRACTAHAMLKNLARAYELNSQLDEALAALQAYLDRAEGAEDQEAIQLRVSALEAKVAPPVAAKPKPAPSAEPVLVPADPPTSETHVTPLEEYDEESSGRSIAPLIVGGVGLATLAVGSVFWLRATSDRQEQVDLCGGMTESCPVGVAEAGNAARDRQIAWSIVNSAGAVVAAAGLIWYFVQDDGSNGETVFAPAVGPGYAGVQLNGSF